MKPLFLGLLALPWVPAIHAADSGAAYFETHIRPLLSKHCLECHSEASGKRKGGLWLDRREGWEKGGASGPAIVPGDAGASLLIQAIRYTDETLQMPPRSRLELEDIATLEDWVRQGAPDPRTTAPAGTSKSDTSSPVRAGKDFWAFQPLKAHPLPPVSDASWPMVWIDHFIQARAEREGLKLAEDAAPSVWLRRVHHDLTGLPPTTAELSRFLQDSGPVARARVVDDLLSRSSFGETWGRMWLDVVRYADSNGGDRNFTYYQAWRYRNWVIDAFNRDMPYYSFIRYQLAGDLMEAEDSSVRADQVVASTFLALGPKMLTERDKEKLRLDVADEQVDTLGRAFLGLALGCARCHDHKFDPISQEDYYALAGIFRSTQVIAGTRNGCVNVASWVERPLPGTPGEEALQARLDRLELAMRLTVEQQFRNKAGGRSLPDMLPLGGVIVDEEDAELIGDWSPSDYLPRRVGKGYVHDNKAGKGVKKAIFRGSLPHNGVYEVRVSFNADDRRASHVPIRIRHWKGEKLVHVDQTRTPSVAQLFEPVGRFEFEKGGEAMVTISTEGTDDRYVIVDAVQWIPVEDLERESNALAMADLKPDKMDLFSLSEGELKKELSKLINELRDEEVVMAPRDAQDAGDIHLRVRGEPSRLGDRIPRGFPKVFQPGPSPRIAPGKSGRLELADWLGAPEIPLLNRVIVNRVWARLFGQGLVATEDDFGLLGDRPSHPKLLDALAIRFRDGGGTFKGLVRELVLSRAYGLASSCRPEDLEKDPANHWQARHSRRRLSAEEMRDTALALSGRLKPSRGEATSRPYGEDLDKPFQLDDETLRSVYLPVARNNMVPQMEIFDAANPDLVTGDRPATTVPTQALFLLNGGFMTARAADIARKAEQEAQPGNRLAWVYQHVLSRDPAPGEYSRAEAFLQETVDLEGGGETGARRALAHLIQVLMASTEFQFLE